MCEHLFHQECLANYLKTQIADASFPLNCPNPACKVEIADIDLKQILSDADYTKYEVFALNTAVDFQKDLSWCPTPDCKYAFVFEQDEEAKGAKG